MIIELINTGSELLLGRTLNTHQQWIGRQLTDAGYRVHRQVTISDDGPTISRTVREALERADIVITTGGLGPTADDLTRPLLAELFGRTLQESAEVRKNIENFFLNRKRAFPSSVLVQAQVPDGAHVFPNGFGTAPGLYLSSKEGEFKRATQSALFMLPGPPRELHPMFSQQVIPFLKARHPLVEPCQVRTFRTTGLGESFVEERIGSRLEQVGGLEVGYCARVGEVDIRLVAKGEKAETKLDLGAALIQQELQEFIYGEETETLEERVLHHLRQLGKNLSVAESCTGGFLAHRLTNIPGASEVFWGGAVVYDNRAKSRLLGVPEEIIQREGAVSEACARAMAEGALDHFGTDVALSITGIAGPGGGSVEKPVGTVFIGLSSRGTGGRRETTVKKFLNQYDRETFKFLTTQQALEMIRRLLRT